MIIIEINCFYIYNNSFHNYFLTSSYISSALDICMGLLGSSLYLREVGYLSSGMIFSPSFLKCSNDFILSGTDLKRSKEPNIYNPNLALESATLG